MCFGTTFQALWLERPGSRRRTFELHRRARLGDKRGRLLAGSVVGNALWEVDRNTGAAKILIAGPEGQADDIAIGPNGEMAWTNYLMGRLRYRENDSAPMRVLAKDLAGLNSLDFDRKNGKLYASQSSLAMRCGRSTSRERSRRG